MKKLLLSIMLASTCISSASYAIVEGERFLQSEEAVKVATYGHTDAKGLKNLLDAKSPMVLLDARGDKWHDSTIIPGARLASYEFTPEAIMTIAPNKDALVVVYCYSFTCPLSDRLALKLVDLGYTHVIEYPGGLSEWRDVAGYEVDRIETVAGL